MPIPLKDNVPTLRFPLVTLLLIAANLAFFAWQLGFSGSEESEPVKEAGISGLSERDQNTIEYGVIPYRVTHPGEGCGVGSPGSSSEVEVVCEGSDDYARAEAKPGFVELDTAPWFLTIFTSMFMHASFLLHLLPNMVFLWVFGNTVEDKLGRLKFLIFYLLAGVAAAYAQTALEPGATVPMIGASGAIGGVIGAYILLYPRARVVTLFFLVFFVTLVAIPAWVMIGIWLALQLIPAVGQVAFDFADDGTAYFAHFGGFAFGLLVAWLMNQRGKRSPDGKTPASA